MSQHLSKLEIDRYLSRTMAPAELFAASEHLGSCDSCYEQLGYHLEPEVAYGLLNAEMDDGEHFALEHPPFEQMSAYANGEMSAPDAERMRSHYEVCYECDSEAKDLRQLRLSMHQRDLAARRGAGLAQGRTARGPAGIWRAARFAFVSIVMVLIALVAITTIVRSRRRIDDLAYQLQQIEIANESLRRDTKRLDELQAEIDQLRKERDELKRDYEASQVSIRDLEARVSRRGMTSGPVASNSPRATAEVRGVETAGALAVAGGWRFDLAYTWQRAVDTSGLFGLRGKLLPARPVHEAHAGAHLERGRWSYLYRFSFIGDNYADRLNTRRIPDRYLHTLGVRFSPRPDWEISLEAENVADQLVGDLAGYPLPGRMITLRLGFRP